jgi:hypothetical protein
MNFNSWRAQIMHSEQGVWVVHSLQKSSSNTKRWLMLAIKRKDSTSLRIGGKKENWNVCWPDLQNNGHDGPRSWWTSVKFVLSIFQPFKVLYSNVLSAPTLPCKSFSSRTRVHNSVYKALVSNIQHRFAPRGRLPVHSLPTIQCHTMSFLYYK